jgi:tetratricopeptide (TPR) repeat protein
LKEKSSRPRDLAAARHGPTLELLGEPPAAQRHKWRFRIAALLLPLALVALLEVVLRWVGYGYPTAFALKANVRGNEVFVDNAQFSRRYFPRGLDRSPPPFRFAAHKPANTTRIFVFGESAAMGDPQPSYGFARILELLLRNGYPERKFEVINAGVTAINSHVIRDIARDLAPRQGDIWIIYMGNNEVVGPFGAGTVFGAQTPSRALIRAQLAFKKLRVGQLAEDLRYRIGGRSRPRTWEGMEMFLKQRVRMDDPRLAKVYQHFEANLRDIIETGSRAGARIVLSTVASNLKDCPPFASMHAREFRNTNQWELAYNEGVERQREINPRLALESFARAAALDDRYAKLQFRLGRCALELGRTNEAAKAFGLARDLDALRFRADTQINKIIAAQAAAHKLKLVDAADVVNRQSTNGIAGDEFLFEHVHFNFEGNYLLASVLADAVAGAEGRVPSRAAQRLTGEECARRLGFTTWDQLQLADEMVRRFQQPPFTDQLDQAARLGRWESRRDDLRNRWQPDGFEPAVQMYRQALTDAPDDWVLHENFAKLLQNLGEPKQAEQEWRAVVELMPHYAAACYSLADVLDGQGKTGEALEYFHRALRTKPDSVEARNGIGLALANQGRRREAMEQYRRALAQRPDFAEARVNFGQLLAEQGEEEQAKAQYMLALRYSSNSAAAHINLGKLLAKENKYPEAIQHYRAALRINPKNAIAHYNLGNALSALGDPEATDHFAAAVNCNPRFAEARYNLGLQFAKQNRTQEALAQFAEAVRLNPDFADGHLNYGVALAKSRRLEEAIREFETVLRLDPGSPAAKKFLEQAQTMRRAQ